MKKIIFTFTIFLIPLVYQAAYAQQCTQDEEKARKDCSEEQFTQYKKDLEALNKKIAALGPGTTADQSHRELEMQKRGLDSTIAMCEQSRNGCIKSCQQDAADKRAKNDNQGAQQDDKKKENCQSGDPKKAQDNAKGTSNGMAEAMQALAGLMAALGMQQPDQKTPEQPLCTANPNDPTCKTDVASNDSNSQLTTGEFRRDDGASLTEGDLTGEAAPTSGPAAAPTMSGAIAGAGSAGLGGGGGASGSGSRSRESGDKKSEFDGAPKINLAGGAMGGGGGAGGGGRNGGSSNSGKGSANPTAGRTSLDGDQQVGKIAAAAEERLRGPASNEPLGGISSVYYLDNFTKVEKRMITERNTLHEH